MSAFDGPISRCEAMRVMVLTDQTQAQCSKEHCCPPGFHCPLAGCFACPPQKARHPTATPPSVPVRAPRGSAAAAGKGTSFATDVHIRKTARIPAARYVARETEDLS